MYSLTDNSNNLNMKRKFLYTLLMLVPLLFTLSSCDDDDIKPEDKNIVEIASEDAQFTTLVSALERTGLDATLTSLNNVTVFAPTNAAFNALGVDLGTISDEALTEILLYHVISARIPSTDIADGQTYVSTAAATGPDANALSVLVENTGGNVTINASVNVVQTDIVGKNGIIHVVDAVIMPLDVVGHASANTNFSELVGALVAADGDLVGALSATGPFTVFAPLNSAFEAISTVVAGLTPEQLAQVLTYHVVAGSNVRSSALTDGMEVTSLNGAVFTINLGNEVTITDTQGNTATVVLTDVQATNGVIHVLDRVILPQL